MSDSRLSEIETCWSLVLSARDGDDATAARQALLNRYGGVVLLYLRGAVRDVAAAEDLFQEFAVRLMRGDFHRADPTCGRFRDYMKTSLCRLVARYVAGRNAGPLPLEIEPVDGRPTSPSDGDEAFLASWRAHLLDRAWAALERYEYQSGRPFHQVLKLRFDRPGQSSQQLAQELSQRMGAPLSADGFRQTLHRARERFAEILLDQVLQSLADPSPENVEQELVELRWLEYCRPALARLRRDAARRRDA